MTTLKNLGVANGWRETPPEVLKCRELKHKREERKDRAWSCYWHVTCRECGYTYEYDSSG